MRTRFLLIVAALLTTIGASAGDPKPMQHTPTCAGESCEAVFRGFFAFFDRSLRGLGANGRSCADCHMPSDQFQLSPASAEFRFQLLQKRRKWNPWADDPLFRPVDADDFHVNGSKARDFRNLRENGIDPSAMPIVIQYNKRDLPNAAPLDEMQRLLNPGGAVEFEACATVGKGVFETLKAVAKGVLSDLKKMAR